MNEKTLTQTTDLGGGWFANQWSDGSMTLRAPDKGQRIDLSLCEVKRLKELMNDQPADWWQPAKPADGSEDGGDWMNGDV